MSDGDNKPDKIMWVIGGGVSNQQEISNDVWR
jgi:hypothetical protein